MLISEKKRRVRIYLRCRILDLKEKRMCTILGVGIHGKILGLGWTQAKTLNDPYSLVFRRFVRI